MMFLCVWPFVLKIFKYTGEERISLWFSWVEGRFFDPKGEICLA